MTVPIQDDNAVTTTEHDKDFDEFSHSARNLDIKKEGLVEKEEEKKESSVVIADSSDTTPTTDDDATNKETNDDIKKDETNIIPADNKQEYIEEDETHSKPPHPKYVTPKDFELLKVIGMGAFGKVLQVRVKSTNTIAAMKVISKRLLRRKISYVANIHAERNILSKINSHPFIVTMHCSFQTREKLFIVMDFCSGGELFLRLGREGVFLERTAAFYIAEIVLALEHLHGLGILHRDLKPENILLGKDGHLCITDFGLAKDFNADDDSAWGGGGKKEGGGEGAEGGDDSQEEDGRANTICGTQEYMAPEMVARKGYGRAADFWSLGCIAYEMLAGKPPFESRKGSKDLFRKIMNERVRMPDGSSAAACQLLKGLLNRDAQSRLGAAKSTMFKVGGIAGLKQCKFFDGLDWHKLERKEIDPPVNVTVDNENDLRHFHDEFVQMKLPRSVMEMSQDHFQPRRCESENFRGFSFIQEDFELPERQHSEAEKYWNNVDADGESLSECASSVFDDDYGTNANDKNTNNNNLETVNESAAAATPAKKKRPPRKKKKKKQQQEEQQKQQDAAANATSPNPAETNSAGEKKKNKDDFNAVKQNIEKLDVTSKNTAAPSPAEKEMKAQQQQENKLPQSAPPPKKPASPPKWESVSKAKKANAPVLPTKPAVVGLSSATPASGKGAYCPPHQRQMQQQPQQTNTYKPAPGSWAGRATASSSAGPPTVKYAKPQPSPPPLSMGNYPPQNRGPPPSPIQSDWRQHSPSWSPRGMVRKQQQQQQQQQSRPNTGAAPPPPFTSAAAPAPPPKPQLWPALGDDFPPPPGGKGGAGSGGGGNASVIKKHQQPSQASWGPKASSAKSAWGSSSSKNTAGNAWR